MEKNKLEKNTENKFYNELDKKTRYQGNCSCLGMLVLLIALGVIIFLVFSYFYINK